MLESDLLNSKNWYEFGICDHIESSQFPHWHDVAEEIARISGCENGSPMYWLFIQCAAASAKLGFDCDHCGEIAKPYPYEFGECHNCANKRLNNGGKNA